MPAWPDIGGRDGACWVRRECELYRASRAARRRDGRRRRRDLRSGGGGARGWRWRALRARGNVRVPRWRRTEPIARAVRQSRTPRRERVALVPSASQPAGARRRSLARGGVRGRDPGAMIQHASSVDADPPAALTRPVLSNSSSLTVMHQPRRTLLAVSTAAALVSTTAACVPLPGGHSLTRRTVYGKQGENVLVADDGSTCRVRGDTYERVQPGDEHTCAWKDADDQATPRAVPDPKPVPRRPPGRP